MKRRAPYVDANANLYAAQQVSPQNMQQNVRVRNYSVHSESVSVDQLHAHVPSRAEGQWQRDTNAQNELTEAQHYLYLQGQGGNAAQSLTQGWMQDSKVDVEKRVNNELKPQSYELDMEIGYDDQPPLLTFEGLIQKFHDEIFKLVKEHSDAEDAENARHREKLIEINTQYLERLSSLRTQQSRQREEFLQKEAQDQLHQYHQAGVSNYIAERVPTDPRVYAAAAAAAEAQRFYGNVQSELHGEQQHFSGGRNEGSEGKIPLPQGRVYNNVSARYY